MLKLQLARWTVSRLVIANSSSKLQDNAKSKRVLNLMMFVANVAAEVTGS